MLSWEITVHGRVQGVGFRHFVYNCARSCSLKGYVKNQTDGTVFIIASGEKAGLETFCGFLRAGNRLSVVRQLDVSELTHGVEYNDFEIR